MNNYEKAQKRRKASYAFTKKIKTILQKHFDVEDDELWVKKWRGSWAIQIPVDVSSVINILYRNLTYPELNKIGTVNNMQIITYVKSMKNAGLKGNDIDLKVTDDLSEEVQAHHKRMEPIEELASLPLDLRRPVATIKTVDYEIKHKGFNLFAQVRADGKISLGNQKQEAEFVFECSDPKVVRAIGEMLILASELPNKVK